MLEAPRRIGSGERHLSFRFIQRNTRIRGVAFGKAEWADHLQNLNQPLDLAFHPVVNEFNGRRSVELQLLDWRPSEIALAKS
jgi:single-stranded-DNA-specific exonuclease